jgi:hypothetical protein
VLEVEGVEVGQEFHDDRTVSKLSPERNEHNPIQHSTDRYGPTPVTLFMR